MLAINTRFAMVALVSGLITLTGCGSVGEFSSDQAKKENLASSSAKKLEASKVEGEETGKDGEAKGGGEASPELQKITDCVKVEHLEVDLGEGRKVKLISCTRPSGVIETLDENFMTKKDAGEGEIGVEGAFDKKKIPADECAEGLGEGEGKDEFEGKDDIKDELKDDEGDVADVPECNCKLPESTKK